MTNTMTSTSHTTGYLRGKVLSGLLLLLILLMGGTLRFMSMNWDDFSSLHPDERFLTRQLLPVVGGALEFTPYPDGYPPQSLLLNDSGRVESYFQFEMTPGLQVGVVDDSRSADVAAWWLRDDSRVLRYANLTEARNAFLSGEVAALLVGQAQTQQMTSYSQRTFEMTSQNVQRMYCEAQYPETGGAGGYFDAACSPLNPHNAGAGQYAYGTLPLFMAHLASGIVQELEAMGLPVDYQRGELVWRYLSAFFETGTIFLVFLIGRRLHSKQTGLLAAALYALMPLAIQLAHFGTVNAITSFFVALALYAAVRVQDDAPFSYYALFGIALGAAVAGRINIAPLAGVIVLAAIVNSLPAFSGRKVSETQSHILTHNMIGVVLAGFMSLLAFRLLNPYAFTGPTFFHIIPNPRFLADLSQSSYAVSGASDAPPNWQWVGRMAYLHPLKDMIFWGIGLFTGVIGWFGFAWAGYRVGRGRPLALRNVLLFAWVLVYFAWMGNIWVLTMRYYIPLYSSLAIFAAWALLEMRHQAFQRGADLPMTRFLMLAFAGFLALIPVYYLQSPLAMTATAIVAGMLSLLLLAGALLPLLNRRRAELLTGVTLLFAVIWGLMFTNIYRNQTTRIQGVHWMRENIPGDFAMQINGAPDDTPLINIGISNMSGNSATQPDDLLTGSTVHEPGYPALVTFEAPASGTIDSIYAPHLGDRDSDPDDETLYISLAVFDENNVPQLLTEATLTTNFSRENHVLGDAYEIALPEPIQVEAGQAYQFKVESMDGSIVSGGSVILTEGTWDDRLTGLLVCELPDGLTLADNPRPAQISAETCNASSGTYRLVSSYDLPMSHGISDDYKRGAILDGLQSADYLAITSNRFYDTLTRNPNRFPLAVRYYDALFSGELGFEPVAVFNESYQLGLLSVSDQHLPLYESPAWLNELEADEAFHVYDHPVTLIFQKRPDYDHVQAQLILNSVPLRQANMFNVGGGEEVGAQLPGVINWTSLEADRAPMGLMMPDDVRERNLEGGTWSERFDSDSVLYTNQMIGAAVWWLTIILFGLVVWPILYAVFPQMGDRGYGVSKAAGLILVGWIAWFSASLKVQLWSQAGIALVLLLLAGLSAYLAYRRREAMRDFLREHWRRLLAIELLTLLLFVAFIGVRLSNPDLWHPFMGGEKPMDFAYFNGVLRSTVFPPINPWYSGGTINYYYLGFVLVGSPVLLLKMVPAFAYNLIIPTLFAITGMAAFSVAFNIVDFWRVNQNNDDSKGKSGNQTRFGNPWVAGIVALLLCVVLGNLDTPRVLGHGIAGLAGYEKPQGLQQYLIEQAENQLASEQQTPPDVPPPLLSPERRTDLMERAEANYLLDRLAYEVNNSTELVSSLIEGTGRLLNGQPLLIGSNRWYWAPTRVLMETPGVEGQAITEFPFFTFLYGDLHAHMISLPVMLFVMLIIFNEVAVASRDKRSVGAIALALLLGGISVGLLRGINTWDWPTFMVFGTIGLGYAWWRRWQTINRASLLALLVYVGGFLIVAQVAIAPYVAWFASTYDSARLWDGGKTPLWAYWNIYGLFLFLVVSLMAWDTTDWLRQTQVRALRGRQWRLLAAGIIAAAVLLIALVLAMLGYQVALIVLPLILWIVVLFFRPGQSATMQYVLVLIGLALSLTLAVEFVVLAGDNGRQNTVFKFYMQVWLLLSVAGGVAFAWLVRSSDYWSLRLRLVWYTPLLIMSAIAVMYPVMGIRARSLDRMAPDTPPTLDGLEYLQHANHYLRYSGEGITTTNDYHIVRWLQENVDGTPVIMEGREAASEYTYTSRISINTGLPSVLGWNYHQRQQRTLSPLSEFVSQREQNIKFAYNSPNIPETVKILRHYDVRYLIVSDAEIAQMTIEGLNKFETLVEMGLFDVAYERGEARVYHVKQDALDNFALDSLVFQEALGLNAVPPPAGYEADSDTTLQRLTAIQDALLAYDAKFVTLDDLRQVEQFSPGALQRVLELNEMNVLTLFDNYGTGRIYAVNQDRLNARATDEEN